MKSQIHTIRDLKSIYSIDITKQIKFKNNNILMETRSRKTIQILQIT